jgi:indole-3-glycerol phosphate synthase
MKTNILDKIVATKREEVARLLPKLGGIRQAAAARKDYRDFAGALRGAVAAPRPTEEPVGRAALSPPRVTLIAEIKKASPSAGLIAPNFDALGIARQYELAGASALSVLTDEKYFQGRIEYLQLIREAVKLPVLRKDFIIDELQIYESCGRGADAILLIVAILDDRQLRDYRGLAEHLKMSALVEVHDERELERALNAGANLVGINNRDLKNFSVNLATTEKLCALIRRSGLPVATPPPAGRGREAAPTGRLIVAESGIHERADVERVAAAGANAILVGESLMRSKDIAGKVKELLGHQD